MEHPGAFLQKYWLMLHMFYAVQDKMVCTGSILPCTASPLVITPILMLKNLSVLLLVFRFIFY